MDNSPSPPEQLRLRLTHSDAQLRAECEVDHYRASGPGGQHRNKTDSAVRLRHRPSGLLVTSAQSRSQHENLRHALARLREALAVQCRAPLPQPFRWPPGVIVLERRLRVSEKNPSFPLALGLALDALAAFEGKTQDAAQALGVTTSSYLRFLAKHGKAWEEANRIRAERGLGRLKA